MKKQLILVLFPLVFILSVNTQAMELEDKVIPIYDGDNGILEKIIRPKCLMCHSSQLSGEDARTFAPEGVNFDTFEETKPHGDKIIRRAVESMTMPPNPARRLDDDEKQAMKNWMAMGFPESTMPTHYIVADQTLELPEIFIINPDGDITTKAIVKMGLTTPSGQALFEIKELNVIVIEGAINQE